MTMYDYILYKFPQPPSTPPKTNRDNRGVIKLKYTYKNTTKKQTISICMSDLKIKQKSNKKQCEKHQSKRINFT